MISHALGAALLIPLGGEKFNPATFSVYCFFGISGFLIAGSVERSSPATYLTRRAMRLYPGYWVAISITAFLFAPLSLYSVAKDIRFDDLKNVIFGANGAVYYVLNNLSLLINQNRIGPTPAAELVVASTWNASLWTLAHELFCYAHLLLLNLTGLLRKRWPVLLMATALWACLVLTTILLPKAWVIYPTIYRLVLFNSIFLYGAAIWIYRAELPNSFALAVACSALYFASLWLPIGEKSIFMHTGFGAFAPLISYPIIWFGLNNSLTLARNNDYSYGLYLYAFPSQQLLMILGIAKWGVLAFLTILTCSTFVLSALSWHLIERRCIRFAHTLAGGSNRKVNSTRVYEMPAVKTPTHE